MKGLFGLSMIFVSIAFAQGQMVEGVLYFEGTFQLNTQTEKQYVILLGRYTVTDPRGQVRPPKEPGIERLNPAASWTITLGPPIDFFKKTVAFLLSQAGMQHIGAQLIGKCNKIGGTKNYAAFPKLDTRLELQEGLVVFFFRGTSVPDLIFSPATVNEDPNIGAVAIPLGDVCHLFNGFW